MTFKYAIGSSSNWDPSIAAEESIKEALEHITDKPSFILFFSTIHYEKNRGFNKILKMIYQKVPPKTPLIGSTVAGFLNKKGVHTRGITILVAYSNEIEISLGLGKNTKRNPIKAAQDCATAIKKNEGKLKNKIIINFTSGPTKPNFPLIGKKWVIKSGILGSLSVPLMDFSTKYLQLGYGREEEVLREITKLLPEYSLIGGSASDDNQVMRNYVFYNNSILKNSIACLSFSTNLNIDLFTVNGLINTGKELTINKMDNKGRIIFKINNKAASTAFVEALGLSENQIDESLHRKTWFYPLAYVNEDKKICPAAAGAFLDKAFAFSYGVESNKLNLMLFSGKEMLRETQETLEKIRLKKPKFIFSVSCCSWIETLGRKLYKIHDLMNNSFKDTPFLVVYALGEELKENNKKPCHLNESFNFLTLS